MFDQDARSKRHGDRGVSILMIAVSMIFILGMAGLGIDLASLYVGRSQAQRAADAAALAAANYLADNGCLSGSGTGLSSGCQAIARQQAEAVGDQNLIAGINPNIQDSDVTFLSTSGSNPQIQVIAARDSSHSNPMPTFFVKIFGINTANVSAKAVAEAYTSSGTGPPVGATCVKPWVVPNCDPAYPTTDPSQINTNCAPNVGEFVIPKPGGYATQLARDNWYPNGPKGETYTLKPGTTGGRPAPGQYYAVSIPISAASTVCPSCASGLGGGGTGSASAYRANIECCNQNPIVCGPNPLAISSTSGSMTGPTEAGVDCLIHQSGSGWSSNCGQDYLAGVSSPCASGPPPSMTQPFQIIAGPNYPYGNGMSGKPITSTESDSVVTVPIWDGTPLQSGQNNLVVLGFLQVFITSEDSSNKGTVYGTIMNVISCGNGGLGSGSGSNPIVGGGSAVPVRLIHE
jgi:Flp pilus assembly protein TadG